MTSTDRGLRQFWLSEKTEDALRRLSQVEKLGLFVGAGTSKESGLPSWGELIEGLLLRVALNSDVFRHHRQTLRSRGASDSQVDAELRHHALRYARWVVAVHGLLGAAAIVKAWLTDDYLEAIQQELYNDARESRMPVEPGPTALQIAALWQQMGPAAMTVATTNYDLLIEASLESVGVPKSLILSSADPSRADPARFTVVHLHGLLPPSGAGPTPSESLVLAEDEYFDDSDEWTQKRSQFAESLLDSHTCLFLGTGLSDPNILSYLYRSVGRREDDNAKHYALVVEQGDQPPGLEAPSPVFDAVRTTSAHRLERMGITAVPADFFCQSAGFLAELRRMRRDRERHAPLLVRLDKWEQRAVVHGLLPRQADRFLKTQPVVRRALQSAVDRIRENFDNRPLLRCEDEILALHLWVYDPSGDELVFVARSDQEFFDPKLLERHAVQMPTSKLVVEAVCSGTVLEASGDDLRSSRWRSMLVAPIELDDTAVLKENRDVGSLMLGAIVLASNQEGERGLNRLRSSPTERKHTVDTLAVLGRLMIGGAVE